MKARAWRAWLAAGLMLGLPAPGLLAQERWSGDVAGIWKGMSEVMKEKLGLTEEQAAKVKVAGQNHREAMKLSGWQRLTAEYAKQFEAT